MCAPPPVPSVEGMDTRPRTSTPTGTPERRTSGVLIAATVALAALALGACTGPIAGITDSDARTVAFTTGANGKSHQDLPEWVPDDATDVHLTARRGGDERILTMKAQLSDLPDSCVPVSDEQPLAPHPEGADAVPSDFRTVSTLRADWWPVEVEQSATVMCGAWWVGERDGALYAFTPERRTVPVS